MRPKSSGLYQDDIKHLRLAQCKLVAERKNIDVDYNSRLTRIMGVEAPGVSISAGAAKYSGPAISVGAPSFETAPVMANLGPNFSLVKEGPVTPEALNNMNIIARPINPVIQQAEEVAARAWEAPLASQGETLEPQEPVGHRSPVTPQWEWIPHPDVIQAQRTKTALEAAGMVDLSKKVASFIEPETRRIDQQTLVVLAPVLKEQLVEQVAQEAEVWMNNKTDEVQRIKDGEEVEELRLRHVEDIEVAEQRRNEIRQAIKMAKVEAEKEGIDRIEGWRIVKYLPPEHGGNRSQIVKKQGPDGSLSETYEELSARVFSSEAEALKVLNEIVSEKPPVKRGKDGTPVKNEDILRVFKHHLVKRPPHDEVVLRIIKKHKVQTVSTGSTPDIKSEKITETRIEDNPDLAELFQKAA